MILFVGSTNPVKVNAAQRAAQSHWPAVEVFGFQTVSGVSEQPRSDEETRAGAQNRARQALAMGVAEHAPSDKELVLGVGMEGGVFDLQGEMWSTVWGCVIDRDGTLYEVNGARVKVPELIAQKIRSGEEMGPVMIALTGESNIKQKQGMFGVITNNFVNRTEEYSDLIKMAIGLWYGKDWQNSLRI